MHNAGAQTLPTQQNLLPLVGIDRNAQPVWHAILSGPDRPLESGQQDRWLEPLLQDMLPPPNVYALVVVAGEGHTAPVLIP